MDRVFQIWWLVHLLFITNLYVTANVWIYWDTKKNFTELHQIPTWLMMESPEPEVEGQEVRGGDLFVRSNKPGRVESESISVIDLEENTRDLPPS